jgi:carboxymethylenebutenolidase
VSRRQLFCKAKQRVEIKYEHAKSRNTAKEIALMKTQILDKENAKPNDKINEAGGLDDIFDAHIAREFADRDVDATMETMVPEPYVHCVPIMTGGTGGQGVRRFYSEHFINQIPNDATVTLISRTIGKDQVVDELIVSFTHDTQWDYLLPGIPPTGKHVEIPHVVVMKFENGKVAHEHVWWDQASLLVQVGLLDPTNLPVAGPEQARELLRIARRQDDGSEKS